MLNYTEARRNLKSVLDTAVEDRVAVVITRAKGGPVIMMAKSEHDSLMETFRLVCKIEDGPCVVVQCRYHY